MDKNLRLRRAARTAFTRISTDLKSLMDQKASTDDIQVCFDILEKKNGDLEEINKNIINLLLDDDKSDLDAEMQGIETYQKKYLELRQAVKSTSNSETLSVNRNPSTQNSAKLKLPKLELRKFNGDIKEWLQFWSQFEKIDKDSTISDSDKFQYLLQATVEGSRAREAIESFPPTAENYPKAINCLKSRFGRNDLLVEVYFRQLLRLVLKNASHNTSNNLCALYDSLESQIRALETLGITTEKSAALLHPLVESCMPEDFLRAWQRSPDVDHGGDPKNRLESLLKFLKSEVESEERINLAMTGFGLKDEVFIHRKAHHTTQERFSSAASLLSTSAPEEKLCVFCNKNHESFNCFKAQKMSVSDKRNILKDKNRCFKCFKANHRADKCKCFIKCPVCNKAHNIIMCPEPSQNKSRAEKAIPKKDNEEQKSINLASFSESPKVLLQTLKVKIIGKTSTMCVRALFDSGSQKSYIKKEIATVLKFSALRQQRVSHSLFGGTKIGDKVHNIYKIELGSLDGKFLCNFDVLDEDNICDDVPSVAKGPWTKELESMKIFLKDCEETNGPIDILIGADVAGRLFTGKRKVLSEGLVATETYLGWTLMGKTTLPAEKEDAAMAIISMFVKDATISDLFSLDVLGIADPIETKSRKEKDYLTKQFFENTVKINKEGRYEIALPWKEDRLPLPSNKDLALKRLDTSTKKLHSDNLFQDYDEVFKEWELLGIIEENPQEDAAHEHYLPHRPVVKQQGTTKVRPVFDASARKIGCPSLNHCLESGPNLLELIPSLLLRFRERRYGIVADIEKAFLQISVRPDERNFLLFFWRTGEENKTLKIMRHTRVVFGVKSSPFLLEAVLEYHLLKYLRISKFDKKIVEILLRSFYVDNLVTSLDERWEISPFIEEARHILSEGKFNLRGWQYTGDDDPETFSLVLGLKWNREDDTLSINLDWLENYSLEKVSKRLILSIAHKIFDPIGFLSPSLLMPKLLLQKLWKDGTSWDTEVKADIKKEFSDWFAELQLLKQVTIKRCFLEDPRCAEGISVHTFCDASSKAYAAAVFVRVNHADGVRVHLLAAKSRVAPVKPISIPRLELLAATVGARLCTSVLEGLQWKTVAKHFWTDSTTVLTWIQKDESWTVFVKNRVQEIRKLTDIPSWKHIPGVHNAADLPSRGCLPRQLLASRWWEGPSCLKETMNDSIYKESNQIRDKKEIEKEKCKSATLINIEKTSNVNWYNRYFSKYQQIIRLVSWILRFIHNCSTKARIRGEITTLEYQKAELKVIKMIQQESFMDDENKKLKNLVIYKDNDEIIRVKTQILYRKDEEEFIKPVLLPSNHEVVSKLIRFYHEKNAHCGAQILLNVLRERYWILNGKKTVRRIISKCVICQRFSSRKLESEVSPLPENRVRDAAVFQITGVDTAGPLYLNDSTKAWVLLFTCAIYRAVHLELVTSISTEAFLMALRRFMARRGRCSTIYCDNGTNFVGASNSLHLLDWDEIVKHGNINAIEWKFNPPTAAWWGGWWERLIRIMKDLLKRVLGRALLSHEEMMTVLCDCESLMNSRPLTYISESDADPVPISPSMFLQDIHEWRAPDIDAVDHKSLNRRIKYRQALQTDLRNRFRSEYLGLLVQKKRKTDIRTISEGDIVLVGTDNSKRINWPLGRVIELIPGKDGKVRLVRVQTAHSTLLRPIQRLYPLEVSTDSDILKCDPNVKLNIK